MRPLQPLLGRRTGQDPCSGIRKNLPLSLYPLSFTNPSLSLSLRPSRPTPKPQTLQTSSTPHPELSTKPKTLNLNSSLYQAAYSLHQTSGKANSKVDSPVIHRHFMVVAKNLSNRLFGSLLIDSAQVKSGTRTLWSIPSPPPRARLPLPSLHLSPPTPPPFLSLTCSRRIISSWYNI